LLLVLAGWPIGDSGVPKERPLCAGSSPSLDAGRSFWTGLSPWLPDIERRQAGPEFARCRRSSRTPARRESRGRIGKGCSRQASQARPRRLSATVANSCSQWVPYHRETLHGHGNAICWVTQAGARREDASRVPPQPRPCPAASCARKICHIALAVAGLPLKLGLVCSSGRSVRAKAGAVSPIATTGVMAECGRGEILSVRP
jgi:hypothetical protein